MVWTNCFLRRWRIESLSSKKQETLAATDSKVFFGDWKPSKSVWGSIFVVCSSHTGTSTTIIKKIMLFWGHTRETNHLPLQEPRAVLDCWKEESTLLKESNQHKDMSNWHLPRAFAICSYWPSTPSVGVQGAIGHSMFQGIWWNRSLDN